MSNANDYAIAWICSIPIEYAASRLMLDSIHETTNDASDDSNDYTLGRIGWRNVVIVLLPPHTVSSTADSTNRIIQRFSSIRFALLVGLGTTVPSKERGIQLGDVVVGRALIQYTVNNSSNNQPCADIPPASYQMRTDLIGVEPAFGGECINKTLRSISNKVSLLQCMLSEPAASKESLGTFENKKTTVHHGLVASGDQLANNNHLPKEFVTNDDLVCFISQVPWIPVDIHCAVIRGLYDYTDDRQNMTSQQDAALAAAACATNIILSQANFSQAQPSIPKQMNMISNIYIELDGILASRNLKLEHVNKPRRFFRVGRVFAMLWTEPTFGLQEQHGYHPASMNRHVFSEIRRFIVVHQSYHASICIPIQTYGGQGIHKRDIRLQDHASLYSFDDRAPIVDSKDIALRDPIGVVVEGSGEARRLHPASLVNFGKLYTIEHGAAVMNIGYVHKSHTDRLGLNWKAPATSNEPSIASISPEKDEKCFSCVEKRTKLSKKYPGKAAKQISEAPLEHQFTKTEVMAPDNDTIFASPIKAYNHINIDQPPSTSITKGFISAPEERSAKRSRIHIASKDGEWTSSSQDRMLNNNGKRQVDKFESFSVLSGGSDIDPGPHSAARANAQQMNGLEKSQHRTISERNKDHESDNDIEYNGSESQPQHSNLQNSTWACPFFRLDPARYLRCGLQRLKRFADVIQHLKRDHTEPKRGYNCGRCYSVFEKQATLDEHLPECRNEGRREFFFNSEFEELRSNLQVSKPELRSKLKGNLSSDLTNGELKWVYIWQTHFSNDDPGSFFVHDLIFEIAEYLRHKNEATLREIFSKGQLDFQTISHAAYGCTPVVRTYWLHPRDPDSAASNANNFPARKFDDPPPTHSLVQGTVCRDGDLSAINPAQANTQHPVESNSSVGQAVPESPHRASPWNASGRSINSFFDAARATASYNLSGAGRKTGSFGNSARD